MTLEIALFAFALLVAAFAGGMRYQEWLSGRPQKPTQIVVTFPESRALELAVARIKADDAVIATLTSLEVVPVSPWMELPWQRVPNPARTFWVQEILDDLQDVRAELAETKQALAHMNWVRARHWAALRKLRKRVALMVPTELAETKADQFTRSLTVAKSAFGRAAELSTALSEIEVARFEATDLDTFNEAVESIYANHSLPITEPIGIVTA